MNGSRRFRLGLLALLSGFTFCVMLLFVLNGVLRQDRSSYFILFEENVKGMVIGSKVNFQGVPFGMVKDIRFKGGKTQIELSVDLSRAEIQDITKARLDRLLVTGQVTVELEGYGPEGKPLQKGSFIEPKSDPMYRLTKTLPEVVPQVLMVLDKIGVLLDSSNALLDDQNRGAVASILQNGERTLAHMPALMQRSEAVLAAVEHAAVAMADEVVPAGLVTIQQAQRALAELVTLQRSFGKVADEAEAAFGGLRQPALAAFAALRTSLDELRTLARQLRLAPDSLIFGVSRPASPAGGER